MPEQSLRPDPNVRADVEHGERTCDVFRRPRRHAALDELLAVRGHAVV